MKMWKRNSLVVCLVIIFSAVIIRIASSSASEYRYAKNWAILEKDNYEKEADVFFVAPTVYLGSETKLSWDNYDEKTKIAFVGATNMEKGIYDDNARFFAPFYHQAALSAYSADKEITDPIFQNAEKEVEDAFFYYLRTYNKGRPLIIAGFSQGADMCLRLLKRYSKSQYLNRVLVAVYAIGWRITEEEMAEYPELKFATGENDTGVIIAFNSESADIEDSPMIPKGIKTLAINPLNWKTDGTVAAASENLGACFTNYKGEIVEEKPVFSGAYIKEGRGSLVVTDITPDEFPAVIFDDGIYHIYDYQFFYRNLEKNVQDRIKCFVQKNKK